MSLRTWLATLLAPRSTLERTNALLQKMLDEAHASIKAKRPPMKISDMALGEIGEGDEPLSVWVAPPIAPGVLPDGYETNKGRVQFAADSAVGQAYAWASSLSSIWADGIQFMGYTYLAELSQRSEYRRPAEILAKNMTRKWLKIHATGEGEEKADRVKAIEAEFKRLDVKGVFRQALELDGFFGRAQIYVDLGVELNDPEISQRMTLTPEKVGRDSLKRLKVIEPLWTYPNDYDSNNPLAENFYNPVNWFVMGKSVHASRLLTVVMRPLPDILKPAYAFGGLSLSQIAKPYVDNWLRTRQSVSDLLHSFTVWVLKMDLGTVLTAGTATEIKKRAMLFNKVRDVRNLFIVDKDSEEFSNVSAPLSGLDHLQAQTQEHMSAVTGIPLSVLLGITPSGLNASNEGEIRTFYDWVEAQQEATLTPHVQYILSVVQLSLFGEIDPNITFTWEPLWTMSEKERSEIMKAQGDTDNLYYQMGALDSEEIRARIANEEDSPYSGLDLTKVITPPDAGGSEEDMLTGTDA